MGPVHFFRDLVTAAQGKWEAAKTALNDKVVPLRDSIAKFGKGIEDNLQILSAHTWKNLSNKLPTGLSQRLSTILLNAKIIPKLSKEELKNVSPNLFQKMTGGQLKEMDDEHLRLILPTLTNKQLIEVLPNLKSTSWLTQEQQDFLKDFLVENTDESKAAAAAFLDSLSARIESDIDFLKFIESNQIALAILVKMSSQNDENAAAPAAKLLDRLIERFLDLKAKSPLEVDEELHKEFTDTVKKFGSEEHKKNDEYQITKDSRLAGEAAKIKGNPEIYHLFADDVIRSSKFIVNGEDIIQSCREKQKITDSEDQKIKDSEIQISALTALSEACGGNKNMIVNCQKMLNQAVIAGFFIRLQQKYSMTTDVGFVTNVNNRTRENDPKKTSIEYEIDTKPNDPMVNIKIRVDYDVQNIPASSKGLPTAPPINAAVVHSEIKIEIPKDRLIEGNFEILGIEHSETLEKTV
jgi:hypothetical protein